MTVAFVTIAAANFLAHARVLAASLGAHLPGARLLVLLADEDDQVDAGREPFDVVPYRQLAPDAELAFRSDRASLASALKPILLRYALGLGTDAVVYLDADVLVTAALRPVIDAVLAGEVTLTPHLLRPLARAADGLPRERTMLRCGTCNAGFIGLRAGEPARAFVEWWASRVSAACSRDFERGVFYDQRWLDLALVLFPGVRLARDTGWNVAYWDLPERRLELTAEGLRADGRPLRFLHFSGFDADAPRTMSRYTEGRVTTDDLGAAGSVFHDYARRLAEAGHDECRSRPWGFDFFADGTPVPPRARALHAAMSPTRRSRFGDPFAAGPGTWLDWLAEGRPLPRFWLEVQRERDDIRAAFPDPTGVDRARFVEWVHRFGLAEEGAGGALTPQTIGDERRR